MRCADQTSYHGVPTASAIIKLAGRAVLCTSHARRTRSDAPYQNGESKIVVTNRVGRLEERMQHRPSGFGNPWLQLGLSVFCVFVSELLLKRGATVVAEPDSPFSWTGINGLESPLVWLAILLIIASFVSWLYVLRYVPLTLAYPLSRVVDVLVPLGCWIFLGERISTLRWCGIALVVVGLAVVAKPVAQMEERL